MPREVKSVAPNPTARKLWSRDLHLGVSHASALRRGWVGLGSPLQIQHKRRMCLSRGGGHQTLKLTSDASGGVSPFLGLRFPNSKIRKLTETISKLLPALKQFQDSGPMQPRLAAAPVLLCTQGSCIFNFTVEAFFFFTLFLHVTESGRDR